MARHFAKVSEEEIKTAFFYIFFYYSIINFIINFFIIWSILKQLSPSGSVKSCGYIPRRFASRYISTAIHISPSGDSCILFQDLFCGVVDG